MDAFWQKVEYEGLSMMCFKCVMLGHTGKCPMEIISAEKGKEKDGEKSATKDSGIGEIVEKPSVSGQVKGDVTSFA